MTQVLAPIQAAGQDDMSFLRRFRNKMGDQPMFYNESFSGDGVSTIFQCQRGPINDDEFLTVTVGGAAIPWSSTYPPTAGNLYIDFDTSTLVFGTAPPAATKNVVITKRIARWRDGAILDALMDGLRQAFPQLWNTYVDTTLTLAVDTYDYALPYQFNDPAVRIASVAVQDIPATVNPFRKIKDWDRVGTNQLHIFNPNAYTPGSLIRIEYMGPYESLGDLQPQAYELPLLYAAGSLMGYGEAKRSRTDTQTVQGAEQALPPGQMQAAGGWYMQQFQQLRQNLERPMRTGGFRSTYTDR